MKELDRILPGLTTVLQIYMTLPITSCEAERKFSKLSVIKNKFCSTMLWVSQGYFSTLSIENITKSLSYEEAIKEYAAKKCRKKSYSGLSSS